jgi:hypothetical protein
VAWSQGAGALHAAKLGPAGRARRREACHSPTLSGQALGVVSCSIATHSRAYSAVEKPSGSPDVPWLQIASLSLCKDEEDAAALARAVRCVQHRHLVVPACSALDLPHAARFRSQKARGMHADIVCTARERCLVADNAAAAAERRVGAWAVPRP